MSSAAARCCIWSTARRTTSPAPIKHGARASSKAYGGNLARKKEIVALNKTDAMTPEDIEAKRAQLAKASRKTVHVISARLRPGRAAPAARADEARRQAARRRHAA